jgi:hypothetical protein
MDWLAAFGPEQTFRCKQLAQFRFHGDRVPLTDRGRGVRKPAQLTAALSFSTVYTPQNGVPPYEDAEGPTRRRLHQPLFRARVLQAYESRCSMCHLRHASLLDASHILDDKHALEQPIVPNGLALCKIHHAGFDQNIIGVSPDLKISVRRDILDEVDGPMLKYGIQALEGQRLTVPRQRAAAPDRERLAVRFADYQTAAA